MGYQLNKKRRHVYVPWYMRLAHLKYNEYFMCRLKSFLFVLILLTWGMQLKGQSNNVVYQHLITGATGAMVSPNVRNIGQTGHLGFILFSNAPAKTCTTPVGQGTFEGSFDNVNFLAFGVDGIGNLVNLGNSVPAEGAFPFVRFNLEGFDTTNCIADVYYSGSIIAPLVAAIGALPYGSYGRAAPVIIGGVGETATNVLPIAGPANYNGTDFLSSSTVPIALDSAGTATLALTGSSVSVDPHTAGYLNNLVLTGSASGTTITIFEGTDSTCGTPTARTSGALPVGTGLFNLGAGIGSVFTVKTNAYICITVATGTVHGFANTSQF